eukprot:15351661-Ditylum_brightwellii.AAC.1
MQIGQSRVSRGSWDKACNVPTTTASDSQDSDLQKAFTLTGLTWSPSWIRVSIKEDIASLHSSLVE